MSTRPLPDPIHPRMPVILPVEAYAAWLDPGNQNVASLRQLLRPYPAAEMTSRRVEIWVNDPHHDDPRCV